MARKLYYKIPDDGTNQIGNAEWDEVLRLQHWYNSEFFWTAGRLGFKMFAVFPNLDIMENEERLWGHIAKRRAELRQTSLSENEIIHQLEEEGLVVARKGGYLDGCLASGFTRVGGNEFDAFLVCEFLLKASRVLPHAVISCIDEGGFIKPKSVEIHNGAVSVPMGEPSALPFGEAVVMNHHVFSIVDAAKYDQFPEYQTTISNFNELPKDEQDLIVRDWNWLGFGDNFDINGDDIQGFDLNKKVSAFKLGSAREGEKT